MTPLPNIPTIFTESEKAKNKNCYRELFEDVEAKGGRTVKMQDFGSDKINSTSSLFKKSKFSFEIKKIFFCQKSRDPKK